MSESINKTDDSLFDADEVPRKFYFDEEDDDDDYTGLDNLGRNHEEVMAILRGMEIDSVSRKNLTREELEQYDCPFYKLEQLEGDYIGEFDHKMQWGGIQVSGTYVNYIEQYKVPLRGFDPRTGVYGIKHAAAGFYSAGCMYMELQNWEKAVANFSKTIELWPRHIYARGYKAFCHYSQKDYLRAGAEWWNAIFLNPIIIAEHDENSRAVVALLDDATTEELKSVLQEHLVNSGNMHVLKDEPDDALEDFNDAIKFNPDPRYLRDPVPDVNFLVKAHHGRVMVYMNYSHYWKFDEWDKFIPDCDILIKAKYHELYALECRGIAYDGLKKNEEALADYTAALAIAPNQSSLYTRRLCCYCRKREYDKALADANEAVRLGDPLAFEYRGIVYNKIGEYEKAIVDCDEALRLNKYNRSARYQRKKARALLKGEPFQDEIDDGL